MYAIKFVKLTAALSSLVIGINAEAQLLGRGGSIGGAFGGTMGSAMNGSVNNMSSSQDMFSGRGRAIKNNATSAVDGNADTSSQIKQKTLQESADNNDQNKAQTRLLGDANNKQSASELSQNTGKTTQAVHESEKAKTQNPNSFTKTIEANREEIARTSTQEGSNGAQNTSDSARSMSAHRTVASTASNGKKSQINASTNGQSEHD